MFIQAARAELWHSAMYWCRSLLTSECLHLSDFRVVALRVCSKRGVLRIISYETQTLPFRFDGRAMGRPGVLDSTSPTRWPTAQNQHAGGRQCHLLPDARGLYLAGLAP